MTVYAVYITYKQLALPYFCSKKTGRGQTAGQTEVYGQAKKTIQAGGA